VAIDDQLGRLVRNFNRPINDELAEEYHAALRKVPVSIVAAAVSRAIQTRKFMPNVCELLDDIAAISLERSSSDAPQFRPCVNCRDHTPGWQQKTTFYRTPVSREGSGVMCPAMTTLVRCDCWLEHQARLAPTADHRKVAHFRARSESSRSA
jgi:hypothetical protein